MCLGIACMGTKLGAFGGIAMEGKTLIYIEEKGQQNHLTIRFSYTVHARTYTHWRPSPPHLHRRSRIPLRHHGVVPVGSLWRSLAGGLTGSRGHGHAWGALLKHVAAWTRTRLHLHVWR